MKKLSRMLIVLTSLHLQAAGQGDSVVGLRGAAFQGAFGTNVAASGHHGVVGARTDLHLPPYSTLPDIFGPTNLGAYVYSGERPWFSASQVLLPDDTEWVSLPAEQSALFHEESKAVAIDGSTLVIGDPFALGTSIGLGFVYEYSEASQWRLAQVLDPPVDGFMRFDLVEVKDDVIVASAGSAGEVVVYERYDGFWQLSAVVSCVEPPAGIDLARAGFALTCPKQNAVHVYRRSPFTWELEATLRPSAPLLPDSAVVFSDRRLVAPCTGKVLTYQRRGTQWSESAEAVIVIPGDTEAVTLATDGDLLLVSQRGDADSTSILRWRKSQWIEKARVDRAGNVALDDGRILIRDPLENSTVLLPDFFVGWAREYAFGVRASHRLVGSMLPGTIELSSEPIIGTTVSILIDDPNERQPLGSSAFFLFSNEHTTSAQETFKVAMSERAWNGVPSGFSIEVPNNPQLLGRKVLVQGLLVESATNGVTSTSTSVMELTLGL